MHHPRPADDLRGDARPDLTLTSYASSDSTDPVTVLLQSPAADGLFGSGVDYVVGATPESVAIGDLNDDGRPDLPVANNGSDNVSVLIQEHDPTLRGTFQGAVNYQTGSGSEDVAIGDLNGDGKPDIAVANSGGSISVLLQSGTPGVFPSRDNLEAGTPSGVAIADFNEDALNDLAIADNGAKVRFQTPGAPGRFLPAVLVGE